MNRLAILGLALVCGGQAFLIGQTFPIGTATDGCAGGTAFTIPGTKIALRYGDFTCKMHSPDGLAAYTVRLDFVEPNVFVKGGRVFDVFVNDQPALVSFDVFASGGIDASKTVKRYFSVLADGDITVKLVTRTRFAVLSGITVTYAPMRDSIQFKVDCSISQSCIAGEPQRVFEIPHSPASMVAIKVLLNGRKLYPGAYTTDTGANRGYAVTIPAVVDGDYIEIEYAWKK